MNRPEILHLDKSLVDNVVTLWRSGELVAMPTETVYGLAADATNGEAVAKIYALKSRPQFNPLIVHVADVATAQRYVEWNATADVLAKAFWPGPLTLVLKRRADSRISELVSAGGDTLAIRIPSHPVARQLLAAFGGGIAAPSANRSGRVSPTTSDHVRSEFGDAVRIIEGGACDVGLESTVLDVSSNVPVILRPGSVTREMIEEVLHRESKKVVNRPSSVASKDSGRFSEDGAAASLSLEGEAMRLNERSEFSRSGEGDSRSGASRHPHPHPTLSLSEGEGSPAAPLVPILKSPGMMESHYAPSLPVRLNVSEVKAGEALLAFGPQPLTGAATVLNLSLRGDLIEAAANLFAHLRALDDPRFSAIAVMPIPNEGVGEAINDRLGRAAVR